MSQPKNDVQVVMTIAPGVDIVCLDPFDLPAPQAIPQITLPPIEESRAVIPVATSVAAPRYWGPEIQAEIDRRFDKRVRSAIKDEVNEQVDQRLVMLDAALREKIEELDRAVGQHQQAAERLRHEIESARNCQSYAMCTPSRRRW